MKQFSSQSQKIGEIGEGVTCRYLEGKGFTILERNHTRKWGEIDIIATKDKTIHFVEVKSVSCRDIENIDRGLRPEENMHSQKIERLKRIIQTYLSDKKIKEKQKWIFDLACVYLDTDNKKAKVEMLENIIL